jgi:RHS repeat-associated protein
LRSTIRCKSILGVVFIRINNYDLINHLVKQETSNSTGVIAGYTYTLDAGGKKVELLENNGRKVDYSYDKIDRLLTEQITDSTNGNRTTGYVYDPIGNRLSKTDSVAGVTTYVYDNNDRLLTETNGSKMITSTYDNNGNNLTRGDGTSLTTNSWDVENRLIRSVTDGSTTIYRYDANGVRVSSKTDGVETRYLVDRNRPHASVVMEYDLNGNSIVDYTYGIGLISQHRGSVTSFYHADGLGSTRLLTDSSGSVTDAYVYDAYGTLLSSSGTTTNSYLYTGEQYDKNLGEYYLRARYYSSSQGRFTGRDPFDGMLSEPLSLNKYAYVHGNPINSTDPTGMLIEEQIVGLDIGATLQAQAYATIQANAIRSSIFTLGVVTHTWNLAEQLQLAMSKYTLKNCNATGDRECEVPGIPIVFYGDYAGSDKKNGKIKRLEKTTQHIYESMVFEWRSPLLSAGKTLGHGDDRTWYNTGSSECSLAARAIALGSFNYSNGFKPGQYGVVCDEYPFYSSMEGGPANYNAGKVSLKFVPQWESSPQGLLMSNANLKWADIQEGDNRKKWYGVVAIPGAPFSGWRNRYGAFKFQ